jgi:catechol 2,3-dioxygenase-like lactoylglutathione lyase family enzyme
VADKFDRIVLAVPDLQAAVADYQLLLGATPHIHLAAGKKRCAWWGLSNTVIELIEDAGGSAKLQGIVFSAADAPGAESAVANPLGVDLRLCDGSATLDFRRDYPEAQCASLCVDHVVLRTDNAPACLGLFRDQLGIRLALDKTVPQWGGRMLFFRTGKLTLEVIEAADGEAAPSAFWGVAYQCSDLAGFVQVLRERGVATSAIRDGRKPGTLVATLKSHNLGIPTLLIQGAR